MGQMGSRLNYPMPKLKLSLANQTSREGLPCFIRVRYFSENVS